MAARLSLPAAAGIETPQHPCPGSVHGVGLGHVIQGSPAAQLHPQPIPRTPGRLCAGLR